MNPSEFSHNAMAEQVAFNEPTRAMSDTVVHFSRPQYPLDGSFLERTCG